MNRNRRRQIEKALPYRKISPENTAGVTIFPNATDTSPQRAETHQFTSLDQLRRLLKDKKCPREEKMAIPLFTRGVCEGRRKKDNIRGPLLVILDCDDVEMAPQTASALLKTFGVDHVLFTTHSEGKIEGLHRYRIFTDFTAPDWEHLPTITEALFDLLKLRVTRESVTGPFWYVPAIHPDRRAQYRFYSSITGGSTWVPPEPVLASWDRPESHGECLDTTIDPDEIRSALDAIPNDRGHDHWIQVGMALHNWGHAEASDMWDTWSAREPYGGDYSNQEQQDRWRSFGDRPSGGNITIATVFHLARAEGWHPERRCDKATPQDDFEEFASERLQKLRELNRRYAFVATGQGRVADFSSYATTGHLDLKSIRAFTMLYANPRIPTGVIHGNGHRQVAPLGRVWLEHYPSRRTYSRIDFLPPGSSEELPEGSLNLWQGWGVDPGEGSCSLFLEHTRRIICDGNEELYRWVVAWMAHLVQRPWEKPETCLVMRGAEGIGKGLFAKMLLKLVGRPHGLVLQQAKHLTGNFNAHMMGKLVVFADEVTWGGNRQEAGILKAMISEEESTYEPKGVDAVPGRSFYRILIASNNDWVVPAEITARRFQVTDVSSEMKGNRVYFKALGAEIEGNGPAALMAYLRRVDLTSGEWPDARDIIVTKALVDQKIQTLDDKHRWLANSITRRCFDATEKWPDEEWMPADDLYTSFREATRGRYPGADVMVGKFLKKVFGSEFIKKRMLDGDKKRMMVRLPPIETARLLFENHIGAVGQVEW